jgi:hypothetical protein
MRPELSIVDLSDLDVPCRRRRTSPRGRLLYLADHEAIAVPQCRLDGGWRCHVVARRHRRVALARVDVGDDEIAELPTRMPADPMSLTAWQGRMLWQAWTFARWPGGQMAMLCRVFAEELRLPHTLVVDLPNHAVWRLIRHVNARPLALRQMLRRLVGAGALTPVTPAREDHWGRHSLIIPGLPFRLAPLPIPAPPPRVIFTGAQPIEWRSA